VFPFQALHEATIKDFGRVCWVFSGDMLVHATALSSNFFGHLVNAGYVLLLVYAEVLLPYHFELFASLGGVPAWGSSLRGTSDRRRGPGFAAAVLRDAPGGRDWRSGWATCSASSYFASVT